MAEVAEALKLNQGSGTVTATRECVYCARYAPARDGRLGSCVGGRPCPHCEPAAVVTSQNLRNFSQPRVATISRQEQAAAGGQESVTLPRSPDTFDGLFVSRYRADESQTVRPAVALDVGCTVRR